MHNIFCTQLVVNPTKQRNTGSVYTYFLDIVRGVDVRVKVPKCKIN